MQLTPPNQIYGQNPFIREAKTVYFNKLPCGRSRPLLFETIDGKRWVVKYQNNPQGIRVLVNEWVSYHLATLLDLPVPNYCLVNIGEQLLEIQEIMIPETSTKVKSGISFASGYIEHTNNNPSRYQIDHLSNPLAVPGMIVMDTWIDNPDRDETQGNLSNVMVGPSSRAKYMLYAIDFGKISVCNWTTSDLVVKKSSLKLRGCNRLFRPLILGKTAFLESLNRLESVHDIVIESIVSTVPIEWQLNSNEADVLIDFLVQRKKIVRKIIEAKFS